MLSPSSPPRQIFEMLLEETQVMFEKIGEPYWDVLLVLDVTGLVHPNISRLYLKQKLQNGKLSFWWYL